MRCDDLKRELASPTGYLSRAEMAGHLADCSSCADWSGRAAHLDKIWEATRPLGPSEAALDVLWAGASVALDAQSVPASLRLEGPTRRRSWVKPAFTLAQAAAILAAALFLFRQAGDGPPGVAIMAPEKGIVEPIKKVMTPLDVNVEPDEMVVVEIGNEARGHRTRVLKEPTPDTSAIPDGTQRDFFNAMESMASL